MDASGLGAAPAGLSFGTIALWILPVMSAGAMGWMNEILVRHTSEVAPAVPDVTVLSDDVTVRGTDTLALVFEDPGTLERLLLALPALSQQALGLGSGPLTGFLVGLLLLSLAEVFRRGTRMREVVEGLV